MSKYVKDLQMQSLKRMFGGVQDLILANVIGLDSKTSYELRVALRQKGINLQVVPNNLARKVFKETGLGDMEGMLSGSSAVIWGGTGIVELAREISNFAKKIEKLELKGVAMGGQTMAGADQVKMVSNLPSRQELLGQIVGQIMAPVSAIINLANGPGSLLVSQLKTIAEKETAPAA